MKTIITLLALSLLLSGVALAHDTRPIDNPHHLPVFAYATEIMPAYFEIVGTDSLYIVDTEGKRWAVLPRSHVGDASSAELTEAYKKVLRHRHTLLSGANELIKTKGVESYLELLDNDPSVLSHRWLYPDCLEIIFVDGNIYNKPIPSSDVEKVNTKPRTDPQKFWMTFIQDKLNEGRVPWFGTGYYTDCKGTPKQLQLMRDGLKALKSGRTPTEQQLSAAPLDQEGVRNDALR